MIYDICIYMYVTHTYKYIYRLYLKSLALMSRETLLHDRGGGGAEGLKILNSSKFLFFLGALIPHPRYQNPAGYVPDRKTDIDIYILVLRES